MGRKAGFDCTMSNWTCDLRRDFVWVRNLEAFSRARKWSFIVAVSECYLLSVLIIEGTLVGSLLRMMMVMMMTKITLLSAYYTTDTVLYVNNLSSIPK